MQRALIIFAARDYKRRKCKTIILLLQLALTLLVLAILLGKISQLCQITTAVNRVSMTSPVFFFKDFTNDTSFDTMISEPGIESRLHQLYQSIYADEQIDAFPIAESTYQITDYRLIESGQFQKSMRPDAVDVDIIGTNNYFLSFFNLSIADGHLFDETNKSAEPDLPEIILGADFAEFYEIGDIIETGNRDRYKVCAVLNRGMIFFDIGARKEFTNLDKMMIVQLSAAEIQHPTDYDAAICSAYLITESPDTVQDIADLAAELDTYTFIPFDLRSQLVYVVRDYRHLIQINTFLDLLLLFFLIINFIIAMQQYIKQNIYEFGIHLLSGATHADLLGRLSLQLLPMLLIACALVLVILGVDQFTGLACLFGLLLTGILCISPVRSIRQIQINTLLRRFRHE